MQIFPEMISNYVTAQSTVLLQRINLLFFKFGSTFQRLLLSERDDAFYA